MMANWLGYRCSLCGTEYAPGELTYTCPKDGGNVEVVLDITAIAASVRPSDLWYSSNPSLWRYLPLLPISELIGSETPLGAAGGTPTYAPEVLRERTGLHRLWVKDESRNPTGSFKDRASAVVVARAQQLNVEVIVTASTGNAGAALAGMSAAVGQRSVIFAPKTAPPAKIAQLLVFGTQVLLVDGSYDDAFDLTIQAAGEFGWYCRNTGYNPFTLEGKKTAAFEIWEWWEHLVRQRVATSHERLCIFVSVGDGNIISGIHKGLRDLHALGWLEVMPRIFGVQAVGSAAIANAFRSGNETIIPVQAKTLADSISVDLPRDGVRAVRAARQTGGSYLLVTDEQILRAISELGKVGIFAEPAGSTAYAGLTQALAEGVISPDDPVLVLNTGNGLKDIQSAMRAVSAAPVIAPELAAVKKALNL
jgi:threonine synthase